MLLIASDKTGTARYIEEFRKRARYFRIIIEEVNPFCTIFLDVQLFIVGRRILTGPASKPTALNVPLARSSAHPRHVHDSWPQAMRRHLRVLSSTDHMAAQAIVNKAFELRSQFACQQTVRLIEGSFNTNRGKSSRVQQDEPRTVWLKMAFHPCIARHVNKAVKCFNSSPIHRVTAELFPRSQIRVAWYNALPALTTFTSRISKV